jgi:hypothetical protein
MIAFEVILNGKRICVAGAEDLCVLTADVTATGKLGKNTVFEGLPNDTVPQVQLHYSVGGLTRRRDPDKDVHLNWKSVRRLRVGDSLQVRVVEVRKADRPKSQVSAKEDRRSLAKRKKS